MNNFIPVIDDDMFSVDSRIEALERALAEAQASGHELASIIVAIIRNQLIDLRAAQ
ncbi:MAG TPA: hypothetical protein VGC31_02585 [Paenirhodobacter sp.]